MELLQRGLAAAIRLPLNDIRLILLVIAAALGIVATSFRLAAATLDYRRLKHAETLRQSINKGAAFTALEIRDSLKGYVEPDCAQTDPSNQNDLRYVADVREPVMRAVERFVDQGGDRRHVLVLADSGMGKTTFCLNFYSRQSRRGRPCAVVPLGRPDAISSIKAIESPTETILLLDALDEDPEAIQNSGRRILQLMEASSHFKAVILTCRSQFFLNDASIPTETGVSVIRPRRAGERGSYRFYKLYLLPFSARQVDQYIRSSYPIWNLGNARLRQKAMKLVSEIPELTVRPMLLALIPGLLKKRKQISELYGLYGFMVGQWLERESKWIAPETLLSISTKLAVYMGTSRAATNRDRVSVDALLKIAEESGELIENWSHLTSRSLLNRDSDGRFKFAHRSIMEFLFVTAAINGEEKCFQVVWTDMMRDLLVSWGNADSDPKDLIRAQEIISMDLGKIGLAPLSTPLPSPQRVDTNSLLRDFQSPKVRQGARRIPTEWRRNTLRLQRNADTWFLRDFAYDLNWKIHDHRVFGDMSVARLTYADAARMEHDGFRLPSLAEFISLVEAQKILGDGVLEFEEFYWVGDELGRSRNIVVRIGPEIKPRELLRTLGRFEVGGIAETMWAYEVNVRSRNKGVHNPFAALAVFVRDGDSERVRHGRASLSDELRQDSLKLLSSTRRGSATRRPGAV